MGDINKGPAERAWVDWRDGTGTLDLKDILRGMDAADAALAEKDVCIAKMDRMLRLAWEGQSAADKALWPRDGWLADLRARAEKGNDDE